MDRCQSAAVFMSSVEYHGSIPCLFSSEMIGVTGYALFVTGEVDVANTIIAVMKFVAAAITGSAAMLAEGFHSTADSGNQLFLLRGAAVSRYGGLDRSEQLVRSVRREVAFERRQDLPGVSKPRPLTLR